MTAPAKAKVATIKLEPGTDLVGTVKFVSLYPEKDNPKEPGKKFSAQWALTGDWNGTESRVYIDTYKLTSDIMDYVELVGDWPDGSPKYKWIGQGSFRLHPYVKDKKHYVTVTPEKNGSPPVQRVGPDDGNSEAATDAMMRDQADTDAKATRKRWADMQESYECCVKIAVKAWKEAWGESFTFEGMAAAAHTLFIEANKRALPPPPKRENDPNG